MNLDIFLNKVIDLVRKDNTNKAARAAAAEFFNSVEFKSIGERRLEVGLLNNDFEIYLVFNDDGNVEFLDVENIGLKKHFMDNKNDMWKKS